MSNDHRPPARTPPPPPQDEPWAELRALTAARIALPRSGASLATAPQLDLRLAHARARDAVHAPLDEARLVEELTPLDLPVLAVASAAADRTHYLMRPDLGRRLAGDADARLVAHAGSGHDVVFVIADGLSARAVEAHARPLLAAALPRLAGWRIAPLVVVRQGRVAIGDEIARALRRHRRGADRRAAGPLRARQHGRLPHLQADAENDRRRPQLRLQHPPRGARLRRRRRHAHPPPARHARAPNLGRAAQGRPPPARRGMSTSTAPQTRSAPSPIVLGVVFPRDG